MQYNVDTSFIHYNQSVFEIFKSKNPTLQLITFENNCLKMGTNSINLGYYRLSALPLIVVMKDAITFFDVVSVCSELANNLWTSTNTAYEINLLLNNEVLDENIKNKITEFYNLYNKATIIEDYLIDDLSVEYGNLKNIINSILYFTPEDTLTPPKKYLLDLLIAEKKTETDKGKGQSLSLVLTNGNFPNTSSESEQNDLDNSGFATILILILGLLITSFTIIKVVFFK